MTGKNFSIKQTRFVTLNERPDLKQTLDRLHLLGWPKFIRKDLVLGDRWSTLLERFSDFQYFLINQDDVIACGHAIPFSWDGQADTLPQGWEGVFNKGLLDFEAKLKANAASAIAIVIDPAYRGIGLSETMVWEMKKLVKKKGLDYMVAPLRPALKSKYPLIPMEEYMLWKRKDGEPFDPWIRAHVRTGAKVLKATEVSMTITAPIEKWHEWTGLSFLSSGQYVIEGGLVPVEIDLESASGTYNEPNVWIEHDLKFDESEDI